MSKFWRHLSWGYWGFSRGINIDEDGDVDGSGFLLRLKVPGWLVRFAKRRLPPPPPPSSLERPDISEVLIASLTINPTYVGPIRIGGVQTIWVEEEFQ